MESMTSTSTVRRTAVPRGSPPTPVWKPIYPVFPSRMLRRSRATDRTSTWCGGDHRNGAEDIYLNRSTDGGATWLASDLRLDTDLPGADESSSPELCCAGDNVYVAWVDDRNGPDDIYFNRSTDGGATWLSSDVRLDTDALGVGSSDDPEIQCSGDNVYVVWQDDRNGKHDIYFNRSTDGGTTWLAQDLRLNTDLPGTRYSLDPEISSDGDHVYVVWQDDRNGRLDIYFNGSTDGGATWMSADVRLNTDAAGATLSHAAAIACSGESVYVAWEDRRNAATAFEDDIYFNSSSDGGVTWRAVDLRLDTDPQPGEFDDDNPRIHCEGDNVYVVFQKELAVGVSDIHFTSSLDGGGDVAHRSPSGHRRHRHEQQLRSLDLRWRSDLRRVGRRSKRFRRHLLRAERAEVGPGLALGWGGARPSQIAAEHAAHRRQARRLLQETGHARESGRLTVGVRVRPH